MNDALISKHYSLSTTNARHIGYYAHHMGSGHVQRGRSLLNGWNFPTTLMSSYPYRAQPEDRFHFIPLPEDHAHLTDYDQSRSPLPDIFHHAPLGVAEIRQRMRRISEFFVEKNPALFITDVSAELTQFARLCSVPTVAFRETGVRNDLPHEQAFKKAQALLFPLSELFEHRDTPAWVRRKTHYTGGICKHLGRTLSKAAARRQLGFEQNDRILLIINGLYDKSEPLQTIQRAAERNPDWRLVVVGSYDIQDENRGSNIHFSGKVADTFPFLKAADVVLGSCGTNTLLEIAHAERPYICLPEERPYEEQFCKADPLNKHGLALVLNQFPEPDDFKQLLNAAAGLPTRQLARIVHPNAIRDTGLFIRQLAA